MNMERQDKLFFSQVHWLIPVILATQEVEIQSIVVRGQPSQKASKTPVSTKKLGVMVFACVPATQEV
jgi:hypothetical protein